MLPPEALEKDPRLPLPVSGGSEAFLVLSASAFTKPPPLRIRKVFFLSVAKLPLLFSYKGTCH